MQEITLTYATLYYKDPIVYIVFEKDTQLGFGEIRELIAAAEKLSGHKPYFVLSDARAGVSTTPMGRKIATDPSEAPLHRGTALLINSNMITVVANLYTSINMPVFPFRSFTNEQEAVSWLLALSLS